MKIRVASDHEDSQSASAIYAESWKAAYKDIFSWQVLGIITPDYWVKSFDGNYTSNRFEIAIIHRDGKDIGAGGFGLSRDYSNWGEITSIYLLPSAWGSGAGKALLDFMVLQLKKQGFKNIHLWMLSDNKRAARFYEKCGSSPTGGRRDISFGGEIKAEHELSFSIEA
ncbi:MAG: GNAT family N-acetyltransferase [Christensenellales bacterium]